MLHESQLACPYCLQLHLQLPFAAVVANDMQTLHYECYYKISLAEAAIVCVCVYAFKRLYLPQNGCQTTTCQQTMNDNNNDTTATAAAAAAKVAAAAAAEKANVLMATTKYTLVGVTSTRPCVCALCSYLKFK